MNCYGTRVLTSGIDLAQYQRNPVLLYMHERGKVVGLVKDVKVEGQDVTGELVFDEATDLSRQLKKQWEFGSVKMVSANFQVLEMSDDKQLLAEGQQRPTVTKSKLIEVSVVDIGGNDDAIVLTHEGKTISLSAGQNAIDGVLPLLDNVSKTPLKNKEMELKDLAIKLGLKETATEAEVNEKLASLLGEPGTDTPGAATGCGVGRCHTCGGNRHRREATCCRHEGSLRGTGQEVGSGAVESHPVGHAAPEQDYGYPVPNRQW